jgi:hypothetical protein
MVAWFRVCVVSPVEAVACSYRVPLLGASWLSEIKFQSCVKLHFIMQHSSEFKG